MSLGKEDGASTDCLAPGSSLGPEGGWGRRNKVLVAAGEAQDGRNTAHLGPKASIESALRSSWELALPRFSSVTLQVPSWAQASGGHSGEGQRPHGIFSV